MINGDGVNPAAEVQTFSSFGATGGVISAANYKALAKFLMKSNANNGYVFDTFVVNFDMYVELMFMSQLVIGTATGAISPVDYMNSKGAPAISTTLPFMNGMVNVVLSSSVPAGKIIAMTKAECIEELVMACGNISESERSITNQSITYVKTEETGYKLAVPKARVVLNVVACCVVQGGCKSLPRKSPAKAGLFYAKISKRGKPMLVIVQTTGSFMPALMMVELPPLLKRIDLPYVSLPPSLSTV